MAVYLPAYCTREDVKTAVDIQSSIADNIHVDSAIQGAVGDIFGLCHRWFHNVDTTKYIDWPNYMYSYPWKVYFDEAELADVTVNVPVVTSGGNVIPNADIFWGDPQYSPPYTYMELNRATTAAFGQGTTPQRDIAITGTFGYWLSSKTIGSLAANVASTTVGTATVSNGALVGVGDTLTIDTERLLVSERAMADTGTAQVSGCTTAVNNDNILVVGDGTKVNVGETIQLDAEWMLVKSITGNNISVERAYDGTTIATHSTAEVYASRLLTVLRGQFGTTAATHASTTTITALLVPPQVHELAIAYSLVYMAQKTAAYARALAAQSTAVPGQGIAALEARVMAAYGRSARQRVI